MQRSLSLRHALVSFSISVVMVGASPEAAPHRVPQQQPQPTFRTGVIAVPINVRVIDSAGRPVLDLTRDDFTIFEDDVRQPIVHFSQELLAAQPPGPALRARTEVPAFDASPQNHRIFLIVLGAGALGSKPLVSRSPTGSVHGLNTATVADPSKALDGLVHLVRDRLLPQDQVALLAYNRASDFTADHEAIAKLLETFRESEEAGAAALARQGLASAARQPADSVFAEPVSQELGFAEYVDARNRRTSDLENVHYGIRYLRYMDGEKHLVYVTAHGMVQPAPGTIANQTPGIWEDPKQLGAAASDARVALHVIQTGGISANPGEFLPSAALMWPSVLVPGLAYWGMGGSGAVAAQGEAPGGSARAAMPQPGWDKPPMDPPVPIPGMNAMGLQALSDLRTIASLTGGHASIATDATSAVDRIDEQTRADYLLAYSPANGAFDGRYRAVRVEVKRPGVRVLYRHGYYARAEAPSIDRRTIVTQGRLAAAMGSAREIRDIGLRVTPTFTKTRSGAGGEMLVRMVIDGTFLRWTTDDLSRRVAHLYVGVFCGDAREKVVGRTTRTLDITLTESRFDQLATQGLPYSVRIPLKTPARFLKVIVYDYEANLLGSTVVKIK